MWSHFQIKFSIDITFFGHFVIFFSLSSFHNGMEKCPSKCFCVQYTYTRTHLKCVVMILLRGYNSQTHFFYRRQYWWCCCCWKHWITNSNQNYWIDGVSRRHSIYWPKWTHSAGENHNANWVRTSVKCVDKRENNVSESKSVLADSAESLCVLPWWRWI